jgi:hypothetical protein
MIPPVVLLEKAMGEHWLTGEPGVPLIRVLVFDTDECTGAKSVMDIIEISMIESPEHCAHCINNMLECFDGWLFDGRQMAQVDTGRATTKRGMLIKMIEQLFWKENGL